MTGNRKNELPIQGKKSLKLQDTLFKSLAHFRFWFSFFADKIDEKQWASLHFRDACFSAGSFLTCVVKYKLLPCSSRSNSYQPNSKDHISLPCLFFHAEILRGNYSKAHD
jgi:hypothetical protein